ncbi:formate dehydrogenase subunit gamma [Halomonas sediminis]|uniref:NADH-quinone oxidoreductase subunit E n=1 Tax=Vreelandella zhuhanensis TaxID=2684210 RepID=A0A7X3H218_9GAMM|nr:formate dehydrogenase subunit gamma [Halomonas zhuhanensis]MWJ29092.1 formate dehydrogenase subunit gamma [Halomonas zhuhanensis]
MRESREWTPQSIQTEIDALKHKPGALLPILHAIQDRFGFVPEGAVPIIAESLGQTRTEVHGVISFYHHFRTSPPGRHVLQVCRAEACQSVGGRALEAHAKARLGIDYHQTTTDREITLEAVYCLGNCACGPSIRVGNEVWGRVTPTAFDALVDELCTQPLEVIG